MASALAEPEPQPEAHAEQQEQSLKRRRSEEPDEAADNKRQRTSPGKKSPTTVRDNAAGAEDKDDSPMTTTEQQPTPPGQPRRKSSAVVDEKQRSKRLFGALLGNLRQPGDRTSKRRQEIESRKIAEQKRQDDERLEDRQRRLERLLEQRKAAQVKIDKQNMHLRHQAMLDKANFLQTETEPRLFYRPWDLRDDEEDRIDAQIRDTQDIVEKEVVEFNDRHGRDSIVQNGAGSGEAGKADGGARLEGNAKLEPEQRPLNDMEQSGHEQASAKSEHGGEANAADGIEDVTATDTNHTNNEKADESMTGGADDDGGEDGEHVPVGDEDAVIY